MDKRKNRSEREIGSALDALARAEWRLISTPAKGLAEIRTRAAVVQTMMTDASNMGRPTDNRHIAALGILVHEIMRYVPAEETAVLA